MRDNRRIPEKTEVRLDRLQVVWLTLGFVVALSIVFALGVLVGKREARLAGPAVMDDPVAQIDADGKLHEELTFYDRLTAPTGGHRVVQRQATAAPAVPPQAKQPAPPPKPAAPATPEAAKPAPKNEDSTSATASLATTTSPAATPAVALSDGRNASQKEVTPSAKTGPSGENEALAELADGPAQRGDYTVQVSSFQSAEEAKAFASSLERKGYKPFVVVADVVGKGKWYRVRMGAFKDMDRAVSAKARLAEADIPAWILKTE